MAEQNTTAYQLGRIRKAIVAGAAAGAAAVWALVAPPFTGGTSVTGILADGKIDANEVGTCIGTFFVVGVPAGYLAWQTPNKPARHESPDVATAAAQVEVQNLALPEITAADVELVSEDAPTDAFLPDPGESAAGVPTKDGDGRGRHEA